MRISTETVVGLFIVVSVAIFLYMSYHVGSFRFDRITYNTYTVYFNDVSGLHKKADVKIAGVKVGWVDLLELVNEGQQVKATLLVDKHVVVHSDAYAIVRQEGFLGTKHLELIPGDPLLPSLPSGSMLTRPTKVPVTIDEMLHQFSDIAVDIQSVVKSLNSVLGGREGEQVIRETVANLENSMKNLASLTSRVDRIFGENEGNIGDIFTDLRTAIPRLSESIQRNINTIATAVDRDFNRIATELETGIKPIRETVIKINEGKGILGQLVNDEEAARDLRTTIAGIKGYFDKLAKMRVVFDIHTETMTGPIEGRALTRESKSYANIRLHATEDYFYLFGLVTSRNGIINRFDEEREWFNDECFQLIPGDLHLSDNKKLKYAKYRRLKVRQLDKLLYNVQFGKIFGNVAFRFGLFDSTGGIGMDIDIPFGVADLRWVTTFEIFDFSGILRYSESNRRPHIKWLNRMFFTKNIYFTCGADDIISLYNKNAFFGMGIRFVDDDIKYLLSRITIMAPT